MEERKITSIEDLKQICNGIVTALPPFYPGTEFNAVLRRPSMMGMVKRGKIDNQLLVSANELFTKGAARTAISNIEKQDMMKEMFDIMEIYCKECFVSPTYEELQNAGIELTDEQILFIFNYAQSGVTDLKSFHN